MTSAQSQPDEARAPAGHQAESVAASFNCEPAAALARVRSHAGPLIVDLDETLYLRNSTEDFINLARPGLLALLLLRVLDFFRPWEWSGGEATRDWWRIRLVRTLFPWTRALWRSQVGALAARHANQPLIEAMRGRAEAPIIATNGFLEVVQPLVAALGFGNSPLIACSLKSPADRAHGKLAMVQKVVAGTALSSAMVVTDSATHDMPLLQAVAAPVLTVWPEARYVPALCNIYLPGQYLSQVKRPGEHYFRRAVLQDDFLLWVLASIALSSAPVHLFFGLLCALIAFWAVYENGYVDNDLMGHKLESNPTLSREFFEHNVAVSNWKPWVWAALFSAAGLFLLDWPQRPPLKQALDWTAVLVATHLWFRLYNRSGNFSRIWMFAVLQFARAAAFLALVPITAVGAVALGVHVFTRWTPYYMYRVAGRKWPTEGHFGIVRLMFFVLLSVLLGAAIGWHQVCNWTGLALLVWCLLRARRELGTLVRGMNRLRPAE